MTTREEAKVGDYLQVKVSKFPRRKGDCIISSKVIHATPKRITVEIDTSNLKDIGYSGINPMIKQFMRTGSVYPRSSYYGAFYWYLMDGQ